jgi:hypothetical protein
MSQQVKAIRSTQLSLFLGRIFKDQSVECTYKEVDGSEAIEVEWLPSEEEWNSRFVPTDPVHLKIDFSGSTYEVISLVKGNRLHIYSGFDHGDVLQFVARFIFEKRLKYAAANVR